MRLKDTFVLPSVRFGFGFETNRSLLKSFSATTATEGDAGFVARALDPALRFLPNARPDDDLPMHILNFLVELRPIVRERDHGIASYGFDRALAGALEALSARLLASVFSELERLISNNATACHRDEYLVPEDVFKDALAEWRISAGAIILAMLDLAERHGCRILNAEHLIWNCLGSYEIDRILDTLAIVS